jgi:hypothetical protein
MWFDPTTFRKNFIYMKSSANYREYSQTKFYEYCQNNSGGGFDTDDNLTHRIIVEATSENEAIRIGKNLGIYFNGCDEGLDCDCCGDRWYHPHEVRLNFGSFSQDEALAVGKEYQGTVCDTAKPYKDRTKDFHFQNVEEYARFMAERWGYKFDDQIPDTRIHYLDGRVQGFYTKR